VRLKGGDPFVFGRGGDEALALRAAGVPFEIVPGVTAAVGATAYAGIPITHRGLASSVTFLTGHAVPGESGTAPDLTRLHLDGTIVFYMGTGKLDENLRGLMAAGRSKDTPAAVIEWGTYPRQRVLEGELGTLAQIAAAAQIQTPALVVVGAVAKLRRELKWFEDRPLFGRRVVVTRARARAGELVRLLRERGAEVFEFPTVDFPRATERDEPRLDVSRYAWIVLTSVNGTETLFERMHASGQDARDLHGVRLCAISARAAEALRERALAPDLAPARYESDFVANEMERIAGSLRVARVLIPRAEIGRVALLDELRRRGAVVDTLDAYRAAIPDDSPQLVDALERFSPDYIVFNSASAARNFAVILGTIRVAALAAGSAIAVIGPIAARAAEDCGLPVSIVPDEHRVPDLVDAIVRHDAATASTRRARGT
jgi:uroporphyrinogen III methyltransferase/synthase